VIEKMWLDGVDGTRSVASTGGVNPTYPSTEAHTVSCIS